MAKHVRKLARLGAVFSVLQEYERFAAGEEGTW
jgi:hypothetical protein